MLCSRPAPRALHPVSGPVWSRAPTITPRNPAATAQAARASVADAPDPSGCPRQAMQEGQDLPECLQRDPEAGLAVCTSDWGASRLTPLTPVPPQVKSLMPSQSPICACHSESCGTN